MKLKLLAATAMLCVSASAFAVPIAFVFDYTADAPGTGFNDSVLGAQRRASLEAAGAYWGSLLTARYKDETILIAANFNDASTSLTPLSATGDTGFVTINGAQFSSPLAEYRSGANLNGTAADYRLTFNSNASMVTDTYLGADRNPGATQFDFQTSAQRGIARTLGFVSRIDGSTTNTTPGVGSIYGNTPSIYDTFLVQKQGSTFVSVLSMSNAGRFAALSSGELYWSGLNATAANGGKLVKLNSSLPLQADGSLNGNNVIYTDASQIGLMTVQYPPKGRAMDADPVTIGMLTDMGWTVNAVPEPSTYAMLLAGLSMIGFAARRRRA